MTKKQQDIISHILLVILIVIIEVVVWSNIDSILLKIILGILIPICSYFILSPIILFIVINIFLTSEENIPEVFVEKRILTFDEILFYAGKMVTTYGQQGTRDMQFSEGANIFVCNKSVKDYFSYMIKDYNDIEKEIFTMLCGFVVCCFRHYLGEKSVNINNYPETQLIEKINKEGNNFLNLKYKIIDPINIIPSENKLELLYSASSQPDMVKYCATILFKPEMLQVIHDKERLLDILMLNHTFINILND